MKLIKTLKQQVSEAFFYDFCSGFLLKGYKRCQRKEMAPTKIRTWT